MRKYLALLFMLFAWPVLATTTVTGHIKDLSTNPVTSGTFVRFWLRGCAGNQPTVNGTAVIAPTSGGVYYFDFTPDGTGTISGTLYSTRDSTGNNGGDISCGGSTTSVWYGMQIWVNGKAGPEIPMHAKNGVTLDITNVTPISVTPVVTAPTGDNTYLRLDNTNGPAVNEALKPAASDAVQFVSVNGNDSNDGLSRGSAKASLSAALSSSSCSSSCVVYDSGPETWSSNPFASFTHQATIYLGPNVFTTNAEVAIPNFVKVVGTYSRGASPGQTVIKAGSSFPTTGTVNSGAALIHLSTTANYVELSNITIDCNNVAASSGYYATDLQENAGLDDMDVINCRNKGVWIDDSGHTGQNWSINKLTVESPSSSATATYEPLHVDGNQFKSLNDITLIGASTPSTNCGFISATVMGRINGLHTEQCTNGLVLDNFQGGLVGSLECKSNVTNCIKITSTNWTVSDSIMGVVSLAVSSPILLDQQDNITINTGAFGGGVGFFTIDQATPPNVLYGDGSSYKTNKLALTSSGGGTITHQAPNTAGTFTITDPAATGNAVVDSATQTLTNKTLTSPVINTGVSGSAVEGTGTLLPSAGTLGASLPTCTDANSTLQTSGCAIATDFAISPGISESGNNPVCTGPNTGCQIYIFPNAHKIVRLVAAVTTAPSGCTTNAKLGIQDITGSSTLTSLTPTSLGILDSGAISISITAGHTIGIGVVTTDSGCATHLVSTLTATLE